MERRAREITGSKPLHSEIPVPFGDIIAWAFVADFLTGIRVPHELIYSTLYEFHELQRSSPSSPMALFLPIPWKVNV